MGCSFGEVSRVNAFALVSYIPGPLGKYLDDLRQELVPGCTAQSHVTVLPPRILEAAPDTSWQESVETLRRTQPFELELADVEVFPGSGAVYLSIGTGYREIENLHTSLNVGGMRFSEPFVYHPHVTLAQSVPADQAADVREMARRRWAEWTQARTFFVERLILVQNGVEHLSGCSAWIDLAKCDLGHPCEPWRWSDDGSLSRTSPFGPPSASGRSSLNRDGADSR